MITEILAPAGDEQSAYAALGSGANAIYLGMTRFSARSAAENFDVSALMRVCTYAHLLGARVYVALNTLVKDEETDEFFSAAAAAWNAGADAILIQDIFLGRELKRLCPEITLHLSTQGGCCNVYGAQVAKDYGFSRVVLARETPIEEIRKISRVIETEVFVQGALCTSYSGQCYFSSFAGGNSGNRGRCKQPCRMKYEIDRTGCEKPAYALSLADLSVGEKASELIEAGVCSLKIEGRMRRPEYVAAAVKYYRAILAGARAERELSALKRTYNRGDYTKGLAFGQDERFVSRNVQGHIGERVGEISLVGGKYFCKSEYVAQRGDGFKILRGGKEVGGATFLLPARGGFLLSSQKRLEAGDEVRLTTDTALTEQLFAEKTARKIHITVRLVAGEKPQAACGDFVYTGAETVAIAQRAPLTEDGITACFQKTDGLPLEPTITVETKNAFLPMAALNAFRRAFYGAIVSRLAPQRVPVTFAPPYVEIQIAENTLTAAISEEETRADITIIKPHDYSQIQAPKREGVYLYLPPLYTERDEREIERALPFFEGIYCEGYYGVALAKKYGVKLFAGTGFNLTNRFAVVGVKENATYFALSKEISAAEQRALCAEGAFALSYGAIKTMDLCYCPFSRTCMSCDRRESYTMTDESGRKFPLRRYRMGGDCRFEVYNCAPLAANGGAAMLIDCSLGDAEIWLDRAKRGDTAVANATRGHSNRSFL